MNTHPFYKKTLPLKTNCFDFLSKEISFETLGKGRVGNNIIKSLDKGIPVVRTTTKFSIPAHYFTENHLDILNHIDNTLEAENQPKKNF